MHIIERVKLVVKKYIQEVMQQKRMATDRGEAELVLTAERIPMARHTVKHSILITTTGPVPVEQSNIQAVTQQKNMAMVHGAVVHVLTAEHIHTLEGHAHLTAYVLVVQLLGHLHTHIHLQSSWKPHILIGTIIHVLIVDIRIIPARKKRIHMVTEQIKRVRVVEVTHIRRSLVFRWLRIPMKQYTNVFVAPANLIVLSSHPVQPVRIT